MRKRLIKSRPKVYLAIFLGILVLDGLVFSPILVYRWRDSVRSEAQYKSSPVCGDAEQGGCRREIESVVRRTYYTVSGRGGRVKTHYVSLTMPGSDLNIAVLWGADHSLYDSLKPGDKVTAEEWEGKIVAIRTAAGGTLPTGFDPTDERKSLNGAAIFVPLLTVLVIFFEYKLIRSIRRGSLGRG